MIVKRRIFFPGKIYLIEVQIMSALYMITEQKDMIKFVFKLNDLYIAVQFFCWAAFIAILGRMWPAGRGLDKPALNYPWLSVGVASPQILDLLGRLMDSKLYFSAFSSIIVVNCAS